MPRAPSPRRYAQAVFQIALERNELETWEEDLRVLATTLQNRELSTLLDAPQVPAAHKIDAIRETFERSVGPLALNLISILATRNLAHLAAGVAEEYGRLLDAQRGIERAEVISAVPLDGGQRARIAELLEGIGGKEVRLTSTVEPRILGGLIARVGDRVIDGSVRTKLTEMRRRIVERAS
jgi:F-type H+-transporting ATPase subunit delta